MGAIVDQAQRDLAEDTTLSCHVEAPAGSGKTRLLTCRLLRLLAQVADPREIVALTFTKKAAGEMKERVSELLARGRAASEAPGADAEGADAEGAWPGETDPEDRRLLGLARAAVERHPTRDLCGELQVMTFHAFCGLLVRHAPARAGVALSTQVLEESDQRTLQQQVARDLVGRLLRGDASPELSDAVSRRLLRLNNSAQRLEEQLSDLIAQRDLFDHLLRELAEHGGDVASIEGYVRGHVARFVDSRLAATHTMLNQTGLGQRWGEFHAHLAGNGATAATLVGPSIPGGSWADLPRWQQLASCLLTKQGLPRKRLAKAGGFYPKFSASSWGQLHQALDTAACEALFQTLALPTEDQPVTDVEALLDLLRLGQAAVARYEERLGTLSAMDFVAAEQRAMAVIGSPDSESIEHHLGHPIAHLLVDEFQDTSRNQWELVRGLCRGWRSGDGRTLCLVGDPKQSIYSFRKAEVALFVAAKDGIPLDDGYTLELTPVQLSCNFRATPALISWCNGFFAELMRDPDPEGDEVAHLPSRHPAETEGHPTASHPIEGVPTTGTPAEGVSLTLFSKPARARDTPEDAAEALEESAETEAKAVAKEARWLAARVGQELARPDPPESIGILLWTRNPQQAYLDALATAQIPVQVKEGALVHNREEGRHLVNLAQALVRPHDDCAWAALLRAPWSWSPMGRIAALAAGGASGWPERLRRGAKGDALVARVHEAMAEGWKKLGREPLADTVERAWIRLEGPRHVARRSGPQGVQSCRVLLDLLREGDVGLPRQTLERCEQRLAWCYEPADPRAVDSRVSMMTVHGAKGLEFDVVFVPYLNRNAMAKPPNGATPPYLLERLPPEATTLMAVAHDQRKEARDPTYQLLSALHDKRRKGEARRLCYVSYTRAKQRLHLSGAVSVNEDKDEIGCAPQSYLRWLLDAEGVQTLAEAQAAHTRRRGIPLQLDPHVSETDHATGETIARATATASSAGDLSESAEALTPTCVAAQEVPYRLVSPSSLTEAPVDEHGVSAWPDDGGVAVARGIVTHAAFERVALGALAHDGLPDKGRRPSTAGLVHALVAEGIDEETAGRVAGEIETELNRCLQDDFLARLLGEPHGFRAAEYQVEAEGDSGEILSGSMDLVVYDGDTWWVIDYKTTQPGGREDLDAFARELATRYAGQLRAYRQMLIRARDLDPARVKAGLYLTATQTWVEIAPAS